MLASDLPWQELHDDLRTFIARRVRNPADVDDLVQRVLLRILGGLKTLRDGGRLHAWVYRTARNVIIDHYRSAAARRELSAGDAADLAAADAAIAPAWRDADERAALGELAACLVPMLARLSRASRDAIRLIDLEGATQREAARRAGVSLSGMKSRVQRGRRELRSVLEACCRIDLDRRGGIAAYAARHPESCACDSARIDAGG